MERKDLTGHPKWMVECRTPLNRYASKVAVSDDDGKPVSFPDNITVLGEMIAVVARLVATSGDDVTTGVWTVEYECP